MRTWSCKGPGGRLVCRRMGTPGDNVTGRGTKRKHMEEKGESFSLVVVAACFKGSNLDIIMITLCIRTFSHQITSVCDAIRSVIYP